MDYTLDIGGSEWIIIVFVGLVLILGTNKLPEAARKFGRAVNEFNKAKNGVQSQINDLQNQVNDVKEQIPTINVNGPVQNERQKLEMIAKTLGIDTNSKSDYELRRIINSKIGQSDQDNTEKTSS